MLCMTKIGDAAHVFGPVPSRRLGRSLGVVNVPPNTCTYDCVYCQLGQTTNKLLEPRLWFDLDTILEAMARRVSQLRELSEPIDYVTFVPNGEPTLDNNLEVEIQILGSVGIQTAVITNASLLNRDDVRKALRRVDRVSLKIDTLDEATWRRINRPHEGLDLGAILDGIVEFSKSYQGTLDTETMLVKGINDDEEGLERLATFIARLIPHKAFLSVPTRPPSESWIRRPPSKVLARAYLEFSRQIDNVECLVTYEGSNFVSTGDIETDLLAILEVHPMRENAVRAFIEQGGTSWDQVEKLVERGVLVAVPYEGETYYIRRFNGEQVIGADRL